MSRRSGRSHPVTVTGQVYISREQPVTRVNKSVVAVPFTIVAANDPLNHPAFRRRLLGGFLQGTNVVLNGCPTVTPDSL